MVTKEKNETRNEIKISFGPELIDCNAKKKMTSCILAYYVHLPKEIAVSLGVDPVIYRSTTVNTKCQAPDVFDEEKGKKIAIAKAEASAYKNVAKWLIKEWQKINNDYVQMDADKPTSCGKINDFYVKASNQIVHNREYIRAQNL